MITDLLNIYKRSSVLKTDNQKIDDSLLHKNCPDRDNCWESINPDAHDANWNRIQLPYIGPLYESNHCKLMVLGLNLNGYGGLLCLHSLIIHLQSILYEGYKKVNFGSDEYTGTLFWHRIAVYSLLIIRNDWIINNNSILLNNKPIFDCNSEIANVFDYISFTEIIKCSPNWDKSQPTNNMWDKCPQRYLNNELRVLDPNTILVLGKQSLYALGITGLVHKFSSEEGNIDLYTIKIEKKLCLYII